LRCLFVNKLDYNIAFLFFLLLFFFSFSQILLSLEISFFKYDDYCIEAVFISQGKMLKSMCNSVRILFLEMKSRTFGILHQMNLILVTLIFISVSLAFDTYLSACFSGSIHVQRTGSSNCPIFFRVSWLYDSFPYPTSCLKVFTPQHTHTHHICYLFGILKGWSLIFFRH